MGLCGEIGDWGTVSDKLIREATNLMIESRMRVAGAEEKQQ